MAQKVMIALDASEGAWHAVEYVARTFGKVPEVEVILAHILSGLPPALWDDGHILSEEERAARERLKANWQAEQEKQWQGLVDKAKARLVAAGLPADKIHSVFKPKYYDVAEDLVNEALDQGCDTIVMGRRGLGTAKALVLGSVTNKVVQNSRGLAVTIVT
jgi:nucleotide-binding universal stress UspA family protein|uniref:Universal stress protein n=1 Tax=Desulfobacca acetoxidans TaxID=60893 RepID=A0A7C3SMH3_9BACT